MYGKPQGNTACVSGLFTFCRHRAEEHPQVLARISKRSLEALAFLSLHRVESGNLRHRREIQLPLRDAKSQH